MKFFHKWRIRRLVWGGIGIVLFVFIFASYQKPDNDTGVNFSKVRDSQIHTVNVTADGFNPTTINAKLGDIIVWTNTTDDVVSVNSAEYPDNKLFPELNLGSFTANQSVQVKLNRPGHLKYYNYFNREHKGEILVDE